ncbi:hypothetical protein BDZ94DRAFT_1246948 [Collybia nuda]|uniref:Uncharacterized protein n=1 Tax=Collybia nuda TaxID=64659 RepID=A0A9P5YG96_9AGAR|nr:hypothetical protein BDZ94DRAFT_1246948 [Collybia nuda]
MCLAYIIEEEYGKKLKRSIRRCCNRHNLIKVKQPALSWGSYTIEYKWGWVSIMGVYGSCYEKIQIPITSPSL